MKHHDRKTRKNLKQSSYTMIIVIYIRTYKNNLRIGKINIIFKLKSTRHSVTEKNVLIIMKLFFLSLFFQFP